MKKRDPDLLLFHAPLLRQGMTTPKAMRDVLIALAPATAASMWFFGLSAILVLGACIGGAVAAEWLFADRQTRSDSLRDASGILTGLLLGLTLPPGLPLWMAFLGGFVGIALGQGHLGRTGAQPVQPCVTRSCISARHISDRHDNLGARGRRRRVPADLPGQPRTAIHAGAGRRYEFRHAAGHVEIRAAKSRRLPT